MPPRNERVATMVQDELAKNPKVGNDVLLEKARAIDGSFRSLSNQQFHGSYRLPALRAAKKASGVPPTPRAKPAAKAVSPALMASSAPASAAPAGIAPSAKTAAKPASTSAAKSAGRSGNAERDAVRQILNDVAREALSTEDRTSFVRLFDSLDERASRIVGLFGR